MSLSPFKKFLHEKEGPLNVVSNEIHSVNANLHHATNMINVTGGVNNITMSTPTQGPDPLPLLSQYATHGAEIDSSARYPPPRCHYNTRTRLLTEMTTWADNDQREKAMFWLYGPAGVGKSAVFQTFAETYRNKSSSVVAVFFLSRPNNRNNPESVFITLAYQLCIQNKEYKRVVGDLLADDPLLPTRHFDVQFRKLIIEPLSILPTTRRLLIVIDGLDECKGEDAQCKIVDLITKVALSNPELPVLWMISSRPEPHLQMLINRSDVRQACWRDELPIDTEEAREDASTYIREEFARIQKKYSHMVDSEWPGEDRLSRLISASSGLFAFSSTIIRFIDDPNRPNPESHLQKVMEVLHASGSMATSSTKSRNPLELLDALYIRILSENDEEILPTTLRILHYLCLKSYKYRDRLSAQGLANYLLLDRASFWSALGKLHSVLQIPSPQQPENAPYYRVTFLHASFQDFLRDRNRSGRFCLPPGKSKMTSYIRIRASEIIQSDLRQVFWVKFEIQPDDAYRMAVKLLSWPAGSLTKWPAAFWLKNKLLIEQIVGQAIWDLEMYRSAEEKYYKLMRKAFARVYRVYFKIRIKFRSVGIPEDTPYYESNCQESEALSWYLALPKPQSLDKATLSLLHTDETSDTYTGCITNADRIQQQAVIRVVKVQPSDIPILAKVVRVWSHLSHPNIHQFLGLVDAIEQDDSKFPAFVGQSITCTLPQYLASNANPDRLFLIRSIVNGLDYLHEMKIYSGELRPSLIFLDEGGTPLLAHMSQIPYKFDSPLTADIELMRYRAKELIWGTVKVPTAACDVYSAARIAFYIILGHEPLIEISYHEGSVAIASTPTYEDGWVTIRERYKVTSPGLQCLWPILEACWTWDDLRRLKIREMKDALQSMPPDMRCNYNAEED